jgi:hypothetical protein
MTMNKLLFKILLLLIAGKLNAQCDQQRRYYPSVMAEANLGGIMAQVGVTGSRSALSVHAGIKTVQIESKNKETISRRTETQPRLEIALCMIDNFHIGVGAARTPDIFLRWNRPVSDHIAISLRGGWEGKPVAGLGAVLLIY